MAVVNPAWAIDLCGDDPPGRSNRVSGKVYIVPDGKHRGAQILAGLPLAASAESGLPARRHALHAVREPK